MSTPSRPPTMHGGNQVPFLAKYPVLVLFELCGALKQVNLIYPRMTVTVCFSRTVCSGSRGAQDAAILPVRRHGEHSLQDGVQWFGYVHVHCIPCYPDHTTVNTASRMESNGLRMYMYMAYPAYTTVNATSRMESNGLGMYMYTVYPATLITPQ